MLELATQHWTGETFETQSSDVMQQLRKAMLELQAQEMMSVEETSQETRTEVKITWNVDEDALLRKLAQRFCCDWEEVAARLPGRTPYMCQRRWEKRLKLKNSSAPWKPEEDDLLLALQTKLGRAHWRDIAVYMPQRTPEAIQNRLHLLAQSDSKASSTSSASDPTYRASKVQQLREHVDRLAARIMYCREELRKLEE